MKEAGHPSRHVVLLFTDLVGSVALKTRFGTSAYAQLISRHDELFRDIVGLIAGSKIIKDTGDGFLAGFARTRDAIDAALRFQFAVHDEPWGLERLRVRVGVHIGEVLELDEDAEGQRKLVGLAADIAARLMQLALPGQVLMTHSVFDDARQYVREHPPVHGAGSRSPRLKWMAHGGYLFAGVDEPIDVFEVGAAELAPLKAPPSSAKARRVVPADEEELLGWRPAAELDVPHRENWRLERKLGEGRFGEVWLARHHQTGVQRVFKFCFDAERVRSLKRELTLFRFLRAALGDREDIAKLHEVQFEKPPYCLESEFTELGSLGDWAERQGGIAAIALANRLDFIARTADAVAAAHSIGVLHKDIKPSNILVCTGPDGSPRPRLADFGIGTLTERARLERGEITITGFTESSLIERGSSLTGTRMYAPPEILAGRLFTVQGDVYSLGVLLYQLVVGDLTRPLATGWERDVSDPLLREDIAACVDGDPARRLPGAGELAEHLRNLEERRAARQKQEQTRRLARRREKIARWGVVAMAVLAGLLLVAAFCFYRERNLRMAAAEARRQAEHAQEAEQQQRQLAEANAERAAQQARKAEAVNRFLQEMLASVDPGRAKGREVTVRYVLDQASGKIERGALTDQPTIEAAVRTTVGNTYRALGRYDRAEPHLRAALKIRTQLFGEDHPDTAESMYNLGWLLHEKCEYPAAEALYREALALYRKLLGDEHVKIAETLNNLAMVLDDTGDPAAAEPLYRQALAMNRRLLGDEHPDVADCLNNLALVLQQKGDHAEVQRLLRSALELWRAAYGDNHPNIALGLNNLAWSLQAQGDHAAAAPLYEQALAVAHQVHGATHPDVALILDNLAGLQRVQGDHAGAEARARAALAMRRELLGEQHPDIADSLNSLALVLEDRGEYAEAEWLYREALALNRKLLGDEHPAVATGLNNLAMVLGAEGDDAEAEPLHHEALALSHKLLGAEHPDTLLYRHNLARFYQDRQRYAEAEPLYVGTVEARRRVLGENHPETLLSLWGLVSSLVGLEKYAEAEPLAIECYQRNKEVYGPTHVETRDAVDLLVELYEGWDKPEQAADWRAKLPAQSHSPPLEHSTPDGD